jgi:hypothetical protein
VVERCGEPANSLVLTCLLDFFVLILSGRNKTYFVQIHPYPVFSLLSTSDTLRLAHEVELRRINYFLRRAAALT